MSEPEDKQDQPTKSDIKKAMTDLQKMGEALVKLSESLLAQIPLPDNLLKSVLHAQTLKSHEAKRRQMQYIGKLMRNLDPAPIQFALKQIQSRNEKNTAQFHLLEKWREELITKGDDALQEFIATHPTVDRQALRQLIRNAQHDRKIQKNTGGESTLFKYLRDVLQG